MCPEEELEPYEPGFSQGVAIGLKHAREHAQDHESWRDRVEKLHRQMVALALLWLVTVVVGGVVLSKMWDRLETQIRIDARQDRALSTLEGSHNVKGSVQGGRGRSGPAEDRAAGSEGP